MKLEDFNNVMYLARDRDPLGKRPDTYAVCKEDFEELKLEVKKFNAIYRSVDPRIDHNPNCFYLCGVKIVRMEIIDDSCGRKIEHFLDALWGRDSVLHDYVRYVGSVSAV